MEAKVLIEDWVKKAKLEMVFHPFLNRFQLSATIPCRRKIGTTEDDYA
jgi:hypothetical protein